MWFHLHTHSEYSPLDGMPRVRDMVEQVARYGQPGLGLTDHGYMSGSIELYRECKKHSIAPFPGSEFYVVHDVRDKKAQRYHLTLLALTKAGYESLVGLSSLSHRRENYHFKPRVDFGMLRDLPDKDGILCLTGCYGGLVAQSLIHKDERVARQMAEMLAGEFPNTYIELQNHRAERPEDGERSDEWLLSMLWDVAQRSGIPVMATQDAHYLKLKDRPVHDLMKEIVVHGFDDAAFRGDGFHLCTETWMRDHFSERQWDAVLESSEAILNANKLDIPALNTYRYHVPKIVPDPDAELRKLTVESLAAKGLGNPEYVSRLDEELTIIGNGGMSSYFILVHDYVAWARSHGILTNARGSASGSLVCWLLGITQLDPIKWGLLFERFLSPDRTKPPDIDLDVPGESRDDVLEYIKKRFDVTQIGTFSTLGVNEEGKGSVFVQFMSRKRRDLSKDEFIKRYGSAKTVDDIPEGPMLSLLGAMRVRKAAGAHAAGFVLSSEEQPLEELIPTMLIPSSDKTVTQMTMEDVEGAGYIKIDVLGLRSLTAVQRCLELLGRDPLEGLDWVPLNDAKTLRELRRGRTETGVFQFEGWAAAKGCKEVGVKSTADCIAIMALYRPATMKSGYTDLYNRRRQGNDKPVYPHPVFESVLSETHGVAIYQEQVLVILRELGFPVVERNAILSALKLSNDKAVKAERIFREQEQGFIRHCVNEVGMSPAQAVECWNQISGFAGYGFNKAHATAYGLLGYQMAYLKTHHPLEYMMAILESVAHLDADKERAYAKEARAMGLKIRQPDVNSAGASWRIVDGALMKGLVSIKGIGLKAAMEIEAHQPYESMDDLIDRTASRVVTGGKTWSKDGTLRGVLETLREAGALRSLGVSHL